MAGMIDKPVSVPTLPEFLLAQFAGVSDLLTEGKCSCG
jgi:hypothetical protein